ncbi:hypothetical protein [Calidithermus chliarophilus]|uniref:hypothetical protein n=1 Tax=Calidithermus chliarophilus TaxID=52023 RepID=UPI0012F65DF5|nr:hypothetical protein [Calidithermus chliarophilus]
MTGKIGTSSISRDIRVCYGPRCAPRSWRVGREAEGLWLLQESEGSTVYTLAGSSPVCPRCGGELYPLEPEG